MSVKREMALEMRSPLYRVRMGWPPRGHEFHPTPFQQLYINAQDIKQRKAALYKGEGKKNTKFCRHDMLEGSL